MRTGIASSRFVARRGAVIATISIAVSVGVGSGLAGCGGGSGGSGGAPPPPRAGQSASGGLTGGAGAVGPTGTGPAGGSTPATPSVTAPAPRDDSPAAAGRVVEAYFQEINAAARDGRVADVSTSALPGCQTCALDIGMTRLLDQRGVRAASAPYEITGLSAGERVGTVVDVRFTAATRPVRLLDPAGRETGIEPAVPTRAGTARLLLTGPGWRIQNITYSAGPPS